MLNRLCIIALSIILINSAHSADQTGPNRMNVLFIAVDDLRPELACYGADLVHSPHIDALASRSLVFDRAYCQYPLCSPSRISLLTGLRPDTTQIFDLKTSFRQTTSSAVTLPELFKAEGYHTRSIGKIFHATSGLLSDPLSWSEPPVAGEDRAPTADGSARQPHGLPYEAPDVADNLLPDGDIADKAIEALQENKSRPFFLAVGFAKPHLPFVAPKKYWQRYESTSVPLAANQSLPDGAPAYATNNSGELRQYVGMPKSGPIPEDEQIRLKQGYLACVEYMDAQLGRVIKELDRLRLAEKTIVVFWGDHGYQLGEHGTWTKHTVWENSSRVPLMIAVPNGKSAGRHTKALVELVDVYPTLTELCHVKPPDNLEGVSMVPLLEDPATPWKSAAFTDWRKNIPDVGAGVGRSIRTDRYRLVEWASRNPEKTAKPVYELYDHQDDPEENVNVADRPENAAIVKDLATKLHSGWKAALPLKK